MKDYQIVCRQGKDLKEVIQALEESVQKNLKFDWEPQGGVCVTKEEYSSEDWYTAYQAMTKNE